MRYVSFEVDGRASWGRVDGNEIIDLGAQPDAPEDLKAAITAGKLDMVGDSPRRARASVRLLPVVPNPSKIFCVGHNYESHRVETGRDKTKHPSIFIRFADTLIGADDAIVRPAVSTSLDFEGELAVVIGKGGRNISESEAMSHVAGVACFNDASLRDWQWHTNQFTPGKNFPGTAPFGPELVTLDEIADLDKVQVISVLNGQVMQSATLDHMLFPIPLIIAYISTFTPLSPGDVIATGTPGGVGAKRNPPVWMKAGDTIEVRISGVGTLVSQIVDEA
ncbi:2-keto-4-pentenoate hydratase/2-oxohepta-3-ene-1,7-dioic acid hydratase [Hoeflea sp. IMCC20628]|uniref:fumarylacetoacetate hydrolase family protein n=1 Tax=Hoeflea sp. IMCC20628 TaxID=1620421 RepID=UPI00063A9262|nr:fumarylacetoacetate hydrolase family protein [Hoeflea sp. IMCC20628]AKI01931.1 2-keto-4-pentenoate hydratase/2-oxohepta-3-ene-1,7-dioic acid hydratase [Hoeflea sp. IMCC20628]